MALYKEEKSRLISFPLGGIGSGSVGHLWTGRSLTVLLRVPATASHICW